jgi:hypothetical protein
MAIWKLLTVIIGAITNQERPHLNNQSGHTSTNWQEIVSNYFSLINKFKEPHDFLK